MQKVETYGDTCADNGSFLMGLFSEAYSLAASTSGAMKVERGEYNGIAVCVCGEGSGLAARERAGTGTWTSGTAPGRF